MVRFKMLAKDVDSSPTEYRTWVTDGYPDFDGYYYHGSKGGTHPLSNIISTQLFDIDTFTPLDFNLPDPTSWKQTINKLPEVISDSQLAVIDGYIYLFGGKLTDKIYRASTDKPTDWEDTGATLPTPLYGSQLAVLDGYVYLFGGNNGAATNAIYSASTSDPLTWTNTGATLPTPLYYSQLVITSADGYICLLGGHAGNAPTKRVLYALTTDPLTWNDHNFQLPQPIYGSTCAVTSDTIYMFGGIINDYPSNNIFYIGINELLTNSFPDWLVSGGIPYPMAFSHFIAVGRYGYLFGVDTNSSNTKILQCVMNDVFTWTQLPQEIIGQVYQSQFAVIYDRLFFFGGNGSKSIYASNPIVNYSVSPYDLFFSLYVSPYSYQTRVYYKNISNKLGLMPVLHYADWKTDYYWEYIPYHPIM